MVTGLGLGFSPSFDEAKKNLPHNAFTKKMIASGAEGAMMSLDEVSDRVREGGNDVRMRAWAGKALAKHGKPTTRLAQAQAVLDALRDQVQYVADPVNTELIAKPHVTLCLDEHGLCMPIGDCDDLVVCFASACASLGIPVRVIGQSFGTEGPTHVIAAVEDSLGNLHKVDPSVSHFRVGQYHPATKEWTKDPMVPSKAAALAGKGLPTGMGTFIGVGGHSRRGVVGIGATGAVELVGEAATAIQDRVQSTLLTLTTARNDLAAALEAISSTRSAMRGPTNLFDPEPGYAITSVANFPAAPIWTPTMDAIASQTYDIATQLINMGNDALAGTRQIILDTSTNDVLLEVFKNDPWGIHIVLETTEKVIFGFFASDGSTLLSGIDNSGQGLTAAQVQAAVSASSSTGTSGPPHGGDAYGVGNPVAIAGFAALGLVAIAVSVYYTVAQVSQAATNAAKEATLQDVTACIASGTCPPDALTAIAKIRQYDAQAAQANATAASPFADVATALKWAAIGGVGVAAVVLLYPIVKEGVAEVRSRRGGGA